ncbi:MAG: hypothetical protein P1V51_20105 [Deltaproteobacteria bacterium]|nr:hypothetical protein [Deltaproteobacteria bacterium]
MASKKKTTRADREKKLYEILDGKVNGTFRGKPVVLKALTVGQRRLCAIAYQRTFNELMETGGFISEAVVQHHVTKQALAAGISTEALDEEIQRSIIRKLWDEIPEALAGECSPEEKLAKASELAKSRTTEEVKLIADVAAVIDLKSRLLQGTIEHHARVAQLEQELIFAVRELVTAGDGTVTEVPLWTSVEALQEELDDVEMRQLNGAWKALKEGAALDFLS